MEGHHGEPAARLQHALGRGETSLQLGQLVVDGDPQGLEDPGRGMDLGAAPSAQGPLDHLRQIEGAGEGLVLAATGQGRGDAARLPLLAVEPEDPGELGGFGLVHQVRGGPAMVAHAHVERAVAHE